METTTYIKQVKLADASHQQQIMKLLNLTEMQYSQNQYNCGLEYAFNQVDGDTFAFETLIRTKSFWAYFKNEWAKRESEFLRNYTNYDNDFLTEEYAFIHSVKGIRASKRIEVLEHEFSALWSKVWKEASHV